MKVLHISAECYPAAKAGGMGDVVGALPKYLSKVGCPAGVLIPKYHTKWIMNHRFHTVYKGIVRLHNQIIPFSIQQESDNSTGFPLFVADIPGKFDRPGIYADPDGNAYGDELSRYLCFQQAVLQWILNSPGQPGVIHCHDHHTGLVPFMLKYCPEYKDISNIPTVFTIHNGAYHGAFGWDQMYLLPFFHAEAKGLLDWQNTINPLATAIKCAWRITTVSPSYLEELKYNSNGMEGLLQHEQHKSLGVLNGIDNQVWNPKTDNYIAVPWDKSLADFKMANKRVIGHRFDVDLSLPLVTFIGRLVGEKGADLLPDLINRVLSSDIRVAIAILGTGQQEIHYALQHLADKYRGRFDVALEYNEGLAHQLYAGSDFLFMPSRVEPCGLNQMYAMRYGTLPIVRSVGGLRDTVPDVGEPDGNGTGIRFDQFSLDDAHFAIYRAVELYYNNARFESVREKITGIDFSWERSASIYHEIYEEMISLH